MSRVEDIKAAIGQLTLEEKAELARWFHGWTDDEWDRQMAEDAKSGRLDKLIAEVDKDIVEGRLEEMP